jgi:hypothetical protein
MRRPIVLMLAVAAIGACGGPHTADPDLDVTVTAASSPEDVVRGYIAALQKHDAPAAKVLTTAPDQDDAWTADPPTISHVKISAAVPEGTKGSAAEGHQQAVDVPVTFDIKGGDGSMEDGSTVWGFLLVRDSTAGGWKIADQGVG